VVEDYQLRYEVAAGIDVAKKPAVVCVCMPPAAGRKHRTSHLQTVPATVPAIGELAAELVALGVQMVSMEATRDYWRIWFVVPMEAGLAVQLVSSSQARNLPGRPKTDKEDARWIARLTEMGMLRSSFVPPPQIRALRVYTRQIWDLTADRTRYWQRLGSPTPPRTPTPSSASGSAGCPPVPAAAGGRRPAAPSAGQSWSSSGTCSTTPPPATATSAPTGTPGTPTAAAKPATPAASSRPSAGRGLRADTLGGRSARAGGGGASW
jgi:hypothetical protein